MLPHWLAVARNFAHWRRLAKATGFLCMLVLSGLEALSQSTAPEKEALLPRFELGGQLMDTRAVCPAVGRCGYPSFAIGPGAAFNITPNLAVDAHANITTGVSNVFSGVAGGRGSEFLIGPRLEARGTHYGFFVKVQPGWMHWDQTYMSGLDTPPYTVTYGTRDLFVTSVGGGPEYSPSSRIHFRAEVSALIVRNGPGVWSDHFHGGAGVYVGLGKLLEWKPPVYDARRTHPFFGPTNVILLTANALGSLADGITTQRGLAHGKQEGDPLARPLVKYGWSGQIAATGLELGGETIAMYGLHRLHQHWIERAIPAAITTVHGVFAYKNDRLSVNATPRGATP